MLVQRRLDLTQLDALTAYLHLKVEPPQILDCAIGEMRAKSPVLYNGRPAACEYGSGTKRSAVRVIPPDIAATHLHPPM